MVKLFLRTPATHKKAYKNHQSGKDENLTGTIFQHKIAKCTILFQHAPPHCIL
jgi:hypothetical protein